MKTIRSAFWSLLLWATVLGSTLDKCGQAALVESLEFRGLRNDDGSWGVAVAGAGSAAVDQPQPLQVEIWDATAGAVRGLSGGYTQLARADRGWSGAGRLELAGGVAFEFQDRWELHGDTLRLNRRVRVRGQAAGGFLSAATLRVTAQQAWPNVQWFAPGMIYGGFEHLSPASIGGRAYYRPGAYTVRIREDRLPAPLLAGRFADGTTLAVLDPRPQGDTTTADANSVQGGTLTDERFRFGAIGAEESPRGLALGYWFPGSEGESTYAGDTYPDGQLHQWRRRFHPLRDGLEQGYEIAFRFGRAAGLAECCRDNWRWAWQALQPQVNAQDLAVVRRYLVDVLAANVVEVADRAGIPNAISAVPVAPDYRDPKTVMGFTGKALESAEFLLAEAQLDQTARGAELRRKAEKTIASFLRLNLAPPEAEGFFIDTGKPANAFAHLQGHPEVYLRSFGDDLKALLRAYQRELQAGRAHPEWLAWVRQFVDWLQAQQQSAGGFPRSWLPRGVVHSASPHSSFSAIPLLVSLYRITGEQTYLAAAFRAGEFCWADGQSQGLFVGATIDNPDVIDKESPNLSLEAYLLLFETTGDRKWLERARIAADIAETWIYIWNVPPPADADDGALHWKRGVPTIGLQLIATGHSLVDAYMACQADEYARLYRHTGDEHYLAVARILLHNTKALVALPGRAYDLRGPGWQQEHYSLAPRRGLGLHRLWLPWVATSQLNGIFGLLEFDRVLYAQLAAGAPSRPPAPRLEEPCAPQ